MASPRHPSILFLRIKALDAVSRVFLCKLISGGQTGVDRAALDVAMAADLHVGGWCPKGRRAEDGRIPMAYPLQETPSPHYAQRTRWNVRDADATLVLIRQGPTGGTALTIHTARNLHKPYRVIDLTTNPGPRDIASWISHTGMTVLNVAGPRESTCPGIYHEAFKWLQEMLEHRA
ncbi:MAG: putative molybdenum carrier protein [Nitrospira sp.]|nr:putative molybdenum carrier protein [Nitrospira sp.]